MQFPESWLREFCNPPLSTQQVADALTMAGLEVEELQPTAPPFTKVVVGEVKTCEQHPDADRLRVCQVDAGTGGLLQIVCGAPNARVGIKVPCALVGAELPPGEDGKPFKIKVGKLRGVESHGMLCSERELKLSEDHGGLLELPPDAPVGQDIREYLKLDDMLFTLKLTPNLGHNLSVYGVARELAAITGAPLVTPAIAPVPSTTDAVLPVKISAPDLCGRFSGRLVKNVNTQAQTPRWMVDRLARCGQRSVAPLVDISNYVMFEYGRPTHIFDADKIHGGLDVRWAKKGESLKLLSGNTITLDETVGIIADDVQVESLAGIMGGDATAVSDATQNIYIEAAFWWPDAVAGRSRRFNFSTDAGHRFERGVDPSLTVAHIERITQLVLDICGTADTQIGPIDDQQPNMPQRPPVALRVARAAKVIGMPVTEAQCLDVFQRLGLPAVSNGAGNDAVITVTPPAYRFDLTIEEDLIEEVIRIIGLDKLPETAPLAPISPQARRETNRGRFAVRHALARLGYQETINFSFVPDAWEKELTTNADPIKLLNPIASDMNVMRSSLLGSLLAVLKRNLDRKASRVRVFEVGRVFQRDHEVATSESAVAGIHQPMQVAGLAYGPVVPVQWGAKEQGVDFYDVKADVEALLAPQTATFEAAEHPALHPGRCARISVGGKPIGFIGELHPQWRQSWELPKAPVLFELDFDAVLHRPLPRHASLSKFQPVERDVAVIVKDGVRHDALVAAARAADTQGLLQQVTVFDIFRADAKAPQSAAWLAADEKSVALRLVFQGREAALQEEQIESARQAVIAALAHKVGARLRA
ncbi:MAG: phenylalanine--tRNA ligase subunit beta [Brachymonas sp.]|nr:phenylalanine--tRNA ligase subunit beta [Brachymonas sp.]